jgi:hypothetical protein
MTFIVSLAFLATGLIIGFLGQNSRMCFVGGFRDFLLVRDKGLLEGLFAFFITSWIISFLFERFGLITTNYPTLFESVFSVYGLVTLIGGFILGIAATLSGGCPLRHHIMLGQGRLDSSFFFIGFYIGIVLYYIIIGRLISSLF